MVQTTRLALFGPVFIVAGFHLPLYRVFVYYILDIH